MLLFVIAMIAYAPKTHAITGGVLHNKDYDNNYAGATCSSKKAMTDGSNSTYCDFALDHIYIEYQFSNINIGKFYINSTANVRVEFYASTTATTPKYVRNINTSTNTTSDVNYTGISMIRIMRQSGTGTPSVPTVRDIDIFRAAAPAVPSGLKAVPDINSVKLTWTLGGADVNGYKIYNDADLIATVGKVNTYTVTDLVPGVIYPFRISAYNSYGESAKSAAVTSQALYPIPKEVSQIVAIPISPDEIKITWKEPADEYFDGVEIVQGSNVFTVPKGITEYIVGGLGANTRHDFKIRSFNSGQKSADQEFFATTLEPEQNPPSEIRNLQSFIYADRIKFTWENPEDTDHHEVRIYRGGKQIATAVTPANSFTDYDLSEHTTYTFVFYTVTTDQRKSAGISITETTKGKPRGKVQGLSAEPLNGQAEITFYDHLEAAQGYNIYVNGVKVQTITQTSVILTGLENGKEYTIQVAALNEWGESERSDPFKVTPEEPTVPNTPEVRASSSNDSITLNWGRVPHAQIYRIYEENEDGLFVVSETTDLFFTSYGLTPGETKTYHVSAINEVGESEKVKVMARTIKSFSFSESLANPLDAIKTGFSFMNRFGIWVAIVLGIIFAPTILAFLFWLFNRINPNKEQGKQRKQRAALSPEEKEKRARERKLNKARDDKYDTLTRMGRISERDEWANKVEYLRPEERQVRAKEERLRQAREQRAAASGGRGQRGGRAARNGR